ncbi:protein tesmin/tso1-like cxc 2 [Phtheirospermum japonicum]|uniref:Protein tesmin/tso1-like cxc 2 n=1 Tax=Phtheirospermum japonicum TaxID=374723 RepID=A0A830CD68_9LAMI|nr:protein tesmin/tso1-like cxc 2 [Phtheirospermum japonicum]
MFMYGVMDPVDPNIPSDPTGKISEGIDQPPDAVTGSDDFISVDEYDASIIEVAIAPTAIIREIEPVHKEGAKIDNAETGQMDPLDEFLYWFSRRNEEEIEGSVGVTESKSTGEPFIKKARNNPQASAANSLSPFFIKSPNDLSFFTPWGDQSIPGHKMTYNYPETAGGSDDADRLKKCNCKKTQCLKRYCDCFAAGMYCAKLCSCQGCFNTPEYEDTVDDKRQEIESRNVPKIKPHIISPPEDGGLGLYKSSPKIDRDGCKRCHCKKNRCLNLYCVCFAAETYCEKSCACKECYNIREYVDKEDGDGCKLCSCKKTQCLKRYCDCFAAGIYCERHCACRECYNRPEYEDTVIEMRKQIESWKPLAFAPKFTEHIIAPPETSCGEDVSRSASSTVRHEKGCKCKKSMCLQKYCECYQNDADVKDVKMNTAERRRCE